VRPLSHECVYIYIYIYIHMCVYIYICFPSSSVSTFKQLTVCTNVCTQHIATHLACFHSIFRLWPQDFVFFFSSCKSLEISGSVHIIAYVQGEANMRWRVQPQLSVRNFVCNFFYSVHTISSWPQICAGMSSRNSAPQLSVRMCVVF